MPKALHFISAGLHTTLQDQGRLGHQAFGVPIAGAMDQQARRDALEILELPKNSPVIEITLIGPKIKFLIDCQIALTGADLSAKINDDKCTRYQTLNISKGDILSFGKALSGCRAYLAIRGHWQVKDFLKSSSASSTETETLTPDSLIKDGQALFIDPLVTISPKSLPIPQSPLQKTFIAVAPAPEYEQFSNSEKASFFQSEFTIDANSNRMGYRLNSKSFTPEVKAELISSAVLLGTIQITSSGQALLLLADAQTTGGYPRFAKVLDRELDKLAQLKPGDKLSFILKL